MRPATDVRQQAGRGHGGPPETAVPATPTTTRTQDPLIVAIETHRRRRGLSVEQLGRAAQRHHRTWYRVLERNSATLPTLHAFARALGLAYTLVPIDVSPCASEFLTHVTTEDLLAEIARRLGVTPCAPGPSTGSSTGSSREEVKAA